LGREFMEKVLLFPGEIPGKIGGRNCFPSTKEIK
jgi:hypothetical protein